MTQKSLRMFSLWKKRSFTKGLQISTIDEVTIPKQLNSHSFITFFICITALGNRETIASRYEGASIGKKYLEPLKVKQYKRHVDILVIDDK